MSIQIVSHSNPVSSAAKRTVRHEARAVIRYGGQEFDCTTEMARIFLKHAREVIESGETELVPLLHSGGIELLMVSRSTPYSLAEPDVS